MFDQTVLQMGFWATWLLIPVIFEEIPMIINFIRLLHHHKIRKKPLCQIFCQYYQLLFRLIIHPKHFIDALNR